MRADTDPSRALQDTAAVPARQAGALGWLSATPHGARWAVGAVFLAALPWLTFNNYQHFLLNIMMINIILAVGLNVVKGFCGQVTVGHIALAAIGAYSSAVLTVNFGFSFWLALPCAMALAGLAGILVGVPSFRLEGAYLALATLGLAEAVRVFISATNYLGAAEGFGNIPAPRLGSFVLDDYLAYYYVAMPLALAGIYISFSILRSDVGRAFRAVREDVTAAAAVGINVRKYKLLAFVISALYAGCAGSLMAHLAPGYLHPNSFTIVEMVTVLLMIVMGGIGHIWGGVIGAVIVTIVFDLTREWQQYQLIAFGMVVVLTVLYLPRGIGGLIDRYLARRRFVAIRKARQDAA
jgi:branched-chain amino acid transport system permease protein